MTLAGKLQPGVVQRMVSDQWQKDRSVRGSLSLPTRRKTLHPPERQMSEQSRLECDRPGQGPFYAALAKGLATNAA